MKKRKCICIGENYWQKLIEIAKKENRSLSNTLELLIDKYK